MKIPMPKPRAVTAAAGHPEPDPLQMDLMRTYNATRWQVFWKLRVPASIPFLFTSLKVAIAISLVHQTRDPGLHRELERIAQGVAGKAALLVGGRAASSHALMLERMGATVLPDLSSLRTWLRNYR